MTRSDALRDGLHTFSTGRPCRRGHTGPRYTSSGTCVQCQRDHSRGVAAGMVYRSYAVPADQAAALDVLAMSVGATRRA
jgi:hypothetical protein